MKKFKMTHVVFGPPSDVFSEEDAPRWLTHENGFGWFWKEHVLTLEVGEKAQTDFNDIVRIE